MNRYSLQILGIRVSSTQEEWLLKKINLFLQKKKKFFIATPNPEMVIKARHEAWFRELLNQASFSLPDGFGLVWASRLLEGKKGLRKRLTGVDFMLTLCRQAEKEGWKVFLLGGQPGVAKEALGVLKKRFPRLVGQALSGPKMQIEAGKLKMKDERENQKAVRKINKFSPELLFVGFGIGKQEAWIVEFLPSLKIGGAMVVGGSFDFISGRIKRAPEFFQKIGLEWSWRLIRQPWRVKRQLVLLEFILLVAREKFSRLIHVF